MTHIMHVQTVLVVEDIEALKIKTGENQYQRRSRQSCPALPRMQIYYRRGYVDPETRKCCGREQKYLRRQNKSTFLSPGSLWFPM